MSKLFILVVLCNVKSWIVLIKRDNLKLIKNVFFKCLKVLFISGYKKFNGIKSKIFKIKFKLNLLLKGIRFMFGLKNVFFNCDSFIYLLNVGILIICDSVKYK